tara:strand:+ start:42 stop:422 length:381 start_codon:yes stop_codon:yes gene_type:complete
MEARDIDCRLGLFDFIPIPAGKLPLRPHVYCIVAEDEFVKIGRTTNVLQRLRNLQCGNPHELRLFCAVVGGAEVEAYLHERLKRFRYRGEWFYGCLEVLDPFLEVRFTLLDQHVPEWRQLTQRGDQ